MQICEVEGCKCRGQRHHIVFRSQGGLDIDLNYKYLCAEHHNMGNCSPHMSREIDIGYKIELQRKFYRLFHEARYTIGEIAELLGCQKKTLEKYLTTDNYLKRGDILLASGHTAVVLSNGSKATTAGGGTSASTPDKYKEIIKSLQTALNSEYKAGLVVDGIPGSKTFGATPTLNKKTRAKKSKTVKALQSLLTYYGYKCDVDGDFYTATEKMVKSFQREVVGQKNPDGEVTARNATWKKLLKLS